jgi:hypothetical protein
MISDHMHPERPMDLRDLRAFSPPRPASETADLIPTRRVSEGRSAPR